jgi:sugar lactone lactonase YvrE
MCARPTSSFLAAVLLWSAPALAQQIITTVAGGGPDNVPAIDAGLGRPTGVTIEVQGNLYIAAADLNRVFRVDASTGILTAVAGSGLSGFSGDGGPASSASLTNPRGVAVDGAGNLFIADTSNNRIRKVDTAGTITTVAGNGTAGFSGDGGPATSASVERPVAVAVDGAGNLFIADGIHERIRRVNTSGSITTVAGNGTFGFSGDGGPATSASLANPSGVAVDGAGNLFIADFANHRIRRVNAAGTITTVAGNGTIGFSGDGGPATSASLRNPLGVAVDGAGNLFIADFIDQRIRRVNTAGTITTVAGNGASGFSGDGGPATSANLAYPIGVAVDGAGKLFIADWFNERIRRVDAAGTITTVAGNGTFGFGGDGGPATSASLREPLGVAVDAAGNLLIADTSNQRIRRVDPAGTIMTVAGNGTFGFSGDGGPATSGSLSFPAGLAVDGAGNLFIADTLNHRIRRVDAAGTITTVAGNGTLGFSGDGGPATSASLWNPVGVAVDGAGNLLIADSANKRIRRVDTAGTITTVAGNGLGVFSGDGGPATSAGLPAPWGLAVDGAGNLFITDTDNHRVRRVDTAGTITTVAGNGLGVFSGDGGPATSASLKSPFGVAVDGASNLLIADSDGRIRRVDIGGTIMTVAGNGLFGFSGDGGPATNARFAGPRGLAVDGAGNLSIADQANHRIRRISAPENTPPGSKVSYQTLVTLPNGSEATVSLTFGAVLSGGNTTVTTSSAGPPSPNGFKLGQPPVYYNITTTAEFTGLVEVCLHWVEGQFKNEANLRLLHYTGTSWEDVTTSVDGAGNTICGLTTNLSPFAIAETAYDFAGFAPPLLADGSASIQQSKLGRTIPVKFRLERFGLSVSNAVATLEVFKVIDAATGTVDTTDLTIDSGQSGDSGNQFRYDAVDEHYVFNLSTKGWTAPATYKLTVRLDDGSEYSVQFSLR